MIKTLRKLQKEWTLDMNVDYGSSTIGDRYRLWKKSPHLASGEENTLSILNTSLLSSVDFAIYLYRLLYLADILFCRKIR